MLKIANIQYLFPLFLMLFCCAKKNLRPTIDKKETNVWKKIKIDFKSLDEQGLYGPKDGKVALNYEFCIQRDEKLWKKVKKIDPSLTKTTSKGRIACTELQWLCIGSTHQDAYRRILYELASLDDIKEILPTYFE